MPNCSTGIWSMMIAGSLLLPVTTVRAQEDGDDPEESPSDPVEDLQRQMHALQAELEALKEQVSEDELERLVERAEAASNAAPEEARPEDRVFLSGAEAMQVSNPEISVAGDFLAALVVDEGLRAGRPEGTGLPLRAMSIDIRSVLDPYSKMRAAVEILPDPEEPIALEELYISWYGVVPSLSLSLGRFRHQFGVLNRWHAHDLDQTEYPLALQSVLGDEGLSGDGVSVQWFMPRLWAHANELRIDVVDGNNPYLFSGERFAVPAVLGRLKNYWDLSESTYLELGLSGAFGFNNPVAREETAAEAEARGEDPEGTEYIPSMVDDGWARTVVAGADLTLYWSPLKRARYRSLTWRSEFYYAQKEDAATAEWDRAWGVYSYLQGQAGAAWFLGVRGDLARPMEDTAAPLVWGVTPYVTFWQSEFVFLRLEYNLVHGVSATAEHRVAFQVSWAAGPHKHEKY
jgi:hypothetical protein